MISAAAVGAATRTDGYVWRTEPSARAAHGNRTAVGACARADGYDDRA